MATNPQGNVPPRPRVNRRGQTGAQQLLYGLILAVLGVVLTIVANAIANATNSSFTVVFYGMTIIGVVYALIGLFRVIFRR